MSTKIPLIFGLLLSYLFVAANVWTSQQMPGLFYSLVYDQKKTAVVEFLHKIKYDNQFPSQYHYYKELWGNPLDKDIAKDTLSRDKQAETLKETLKKNPQSRDLLLQLSLLYFNGGDLPQAALFYKKARAIDPWVDIPQLRDLIH